MQPSHGAAPPLFPAPPLVPPPPTHPPTMPSDPPSPGPAKFDTLFKLPAFRPPDALLTLLGRAMEDDHFGAGKDDAEGDNPDIPAGYTYFGQFVDHDITFDLTRDFPKTIVDPQTVEQGRTPALDLDSLYGAGPEAQPELYEENVPVEQARFRFGATRAGNGLPSFPLDLRRHENKRAIIADERNDENVAVAQMHRAFQQFHNRVLDDLLAGKIAPLADGTPFEQARQLVRWHYQWIVLHDFVRRLVEPEILERVLEQGRRVYLWENHSSGRPYMPIEHSAAAFRLGHSMIRQNYNFNRVFNTDTIERPAMLFRMLKTTGRRPDGDAPIPSTWIIDWRRFFVVDGPGAVPVIRNASRKLNTRLANPLRALPEFAGTDQPASLAERNLLRGSRLGLPSGQALARKLELELLTSDELTSTRNDGVPAPPELVPETPLWFYLLKEAEVKHEGNRLGPLGSTIVAEVFVGLLQGDPRSFLKAAPGWTPTLPAAQAGHFTMADLLTYVGDINPLG